MDPDLLAEYAMRGVGGKDTQWVDGPTIDLTIVYGHKKRQLRSAFYKDGQTHWALDVEGIEPIKKIDVYGSISVAFFTVVLKAVLASGEEVTLFNTEHAERNHRYETEAEIEAGIRCRLLITIGE